MQFETTTPTGRPAWPLILLGGIEGAGKSWTAAAASALDMFGRTLFLEVGEQMADEYGAIPGAKYEIIRHDGSERQIVQAAQWAAEQPTTDGKPNLLIIDSMTEVWQVMQDEQQAIANRRAQAKGRSTASDATITMDQWNKAKDHFNDVVMAARKFPGPVIMTARLDNVSVVEGGSPTGEKIWKIRSEKNLPYAATVILQAREPRRWTLTKIASRVLQLPPEGSMAWPDFTVEELLVRMELDNPENVVSSTYVRPTANEAAATSTDTRNDAAPTPPPGDLPPFPTDFKDQLAAAEADLNLEAIGNLGRIIAAHERAGTEGARIAKARAEGAWKRVDARIKAGEQPAGEENQDPNLETSEQQSPSSDEQGSSEATPSSEPEEAAPSDPGTSPESPAAEEPTPEPSTAESEGTTETAPSGPSDRETSAPEGLDGMPEPQWGVNKDSGQPVHDPAKRRDSKRRTGILTELETEAGKTGKSIDDLVYEQIGLEPAEAGTDALQSILTHYAKA